MSASAISAVLILVATDTSVSASTPAVVLAEVAAVVTPTQVPFSILILRLASLAMAHLLVRITLSVAPLTT